MEDYFWSKKIVLVTGASGFIGSNLVKKLLDKDCSVVATVRVGKVNNLTSALKRLNCNSLDNLTIEEVDLLDFKEVSRICEKNNVDTIFHLASYSILIDSANSPYASFNNNIIGSLNILETARMFKIPRVVLASSYKSYGEHAVSGSFENLPYKESYALHPLDVYSASKASMDILAQTYFFQFKVPVMVARPCNIFGEGDMNFSRLIPKSIISLLSGKSPVLNEGAGSILKEFIYIDDVVNAYLFLAEKTQEYYGKDFCNTPKNILDNYSFPFFNIGSYASEDLLDVGKCEYIKSIPDVIKILQNKIIDSNILIKDNHANLKEVSSQFSDSSKLIKLGFKTNNNFYLNLDKTIAWYKENYNDIIYFAEKFIT